MNKSSGEVFLERIRSKALERIEKKIQWGEELISGMRENDKVPFPAQVMRVYEMVENGTKRIVLADSTGFGKTYVSAMILGLLNKKKLKKHKVLLVAPKQSIHTAWVEDEINGYLTGLDINSGKPLKIRNLENSNLEESLGNTDILSINYEKFSCKSSEKYINSVLDMTKYLDLIILDEGQNAGGEIREKNIERLVQNTLNKRFIYLSATPGQNGLEDLGIALHIVDPKNYPLEEYDYESNPSAIRDMIATGRWFNSDRETVKELFGLSTLKIHSPVYCDLGSYYAKRYLKVWENGDLGVMHKIARMRKYLLLGKLRSREGKADLEALLESFPRDDSIIAYTHFKTGISEELLEFLESFYGKGKVAMINGDVKDVDERIEISRRFRDGKIKVLANSLRTMGEGVPCTAGEKNVRLLFLEEPYNHGQLNQCIGRPYRPGQKGKVDVHFVLGKNEWLREKMNEIKESCKLERKYSVIFHKDWRDTLIDFDIYEIMQEKDKIDKEKIRNALPLDEAERMIMSYNENNPQSVKSAQKGGVFRSLPIKIKKSFTGNKMKEFTFKCHKLYGAGQRELYKSSLGKGNLNEESKIMLEAHADERILDTAAGDTARLIKIVIEGIEKKEERKFEKLLDVGCGTGVVSRILGREMMNVDLDKRMLNVCRQYGLGPCKHGFMTNLPFGNKKFDLVTASYSLFYLNQKNGEREMEEAFLEINRVLKEDGYFIASLNRKTTARDFKTISMMAHYCEFKSVLNGFFKGYMSDGRKSKFRGAYIIAGRKDSDCEVWSEVEGGFNVYDWRYGLSGRAGGENITDPLIEGVKTCKFHRVHSDEFKNERGTSLSDILQKLKC